MKRQRSIAIVASTVALVFAAAASPALAAPDRAYEPAGRFVIGVQPSKRADVETTVKAMGARLVDRSRFGRFIVVEGPSGVSAASFAERFSGKAGVRYATPSRIMRAAYVPNDSMYAPQWHLPKIGAPIAWDVTMGDPNVLIAIVDGGVDLTHPDLAANIDTVRDYDFVNKDFEAQDDEGHGTHVAGIAAAVTDNGAGVAGVAGSARILPVKVLDQYGVGYDSDIANGIEYAAYQGADVINLSLGGPQVSPPIAEAVALARSLGSIVVAAAGNEQSWLPYYPAATPGVIGVAATSQSDVYSSYTNHGSYIDIAAPGDNILSTVPGGGYAAMGGTSMASPVVAGGIALLLADNPGWTEADVWDRLAFAATDLGAPGRDDYYGVGRINLGSALDPAETNDEIPGDPLSAGAVSGRLHHVVDPHDVWAVRLSAGRTFTASLSTGAGGTFDMRLLAPGSASLSDPVTSTVSAGLPKRIDYTVTASEDATYYVDVSALSGYDRYQLTWRLGYPASVTAQASETTVSPDTTVTVSGTVERTHGGVAPGALVILQSRPLTSATWTEVARGSADASGTFSAPVRARVRADYRLVVPEQEAAQACESTPVRVDVAARLTAPSKPSYVREDRTFTSSLWVYPRHTVGSREVKFTAYRLESGTWKPRRSAYGYQSGSITLATRVSAKLNLPFRGKWKIVARIGEDSYHLKGAATSSVFVAH